MEKCRQAAADGSEQVGQGVVEADIQRTVGYEVGKVRVPIDQIYQCTNKQSRCTDQYPVLVYGAPVIFTLLLHIASRMDGVHQGML